MKDIGHFPEILFRSMSFQYNHDQLVWNSSPRSKPGIIRKDLETVTFQERIKCRDVLCDPHLGAGSEWPFSRVNDTVLAVVVEGG